MTHDFRFNGCCFLQCALLIIASRVNVYLSPGINMLWRVSSLLHCSLHSVILPFHKCLESFRERVQLKVRVGQISRAIGFTQFLFPATPISQSPIVSIAIIKRQIVLSRSIHRSFLPPVIRPSRHQPLICSSLINWRNLSGHSLHQRVSARSFFMHSPISWRQLTYCQPLILWNGMHLVYISLSSMFSPILSFPCRSHFHLPSIDPHFLFHLLPSYSFHMFLLVCLSVSLSCVCLILNTSGCSLTPLFGSSFVSMDSMSGNHESLAYLI